MTGIGGGAESGLRNFILSGKSDLFSCILGAEASEYIFASSASTCTGSYQGSGNNNGKDCGILASGVVTNYLFKQNYD
jgi:hypothetical protein